MEDPTVTDLIELPARVIKQPTPEMNPRGDCGACVLAGLLGITLEEVYLQLHPAKKVQSFGFDDMFQALRDAKYEFGKVDRFVARTPHWPIWDSRRAWGDASWLQSLEWEEWLRMAFEAGYYAIAQVRSTHEPMVFETNHWVLYAGLRTKWQNPKGSYPNTGKHELLVSDSGRTKPHEAWFEVGTHLKERGGFQVLLARPTTQVKAAG